MRTRSGEQGSVLIIAVIAMLIMGVLSVSFALLSQVESKIGVNYRQQAQAEALAEAGLNHAFSVVKATANLQTSLGTPNLLSGVALAGGTYSARIDNDCAGYNVVPAPIEDTGCPTVTDTNRQAVVTAWATVGSGRARVRGILSLDDPWKHVCSAPTPDGYCTQNTMGNPDVVPADPNDLNGPALYDDLPRPILGCSRIDPLIHRGPTILAANQTAGCVANPNMYTYPYPTAPTAAPRMVVMGPAPATPGFVACYRTTAAGTPAVAQDPTGTAPVYFGYFDCALSTPCQPADGDLCPFGPRRGCLHATDARVDPTNPANLPTPTVLDTAAQPLDAVGGRYAPAPCAAAADQGMVQGAVSINLGLTGTPARPFTTYLLNTGAPNALDMEAQGVPIYGTVVIEGGNTAKNKSVICTGGPNPSPAPPDGTCHTNLPSTTPAEIITGTAFGYPLASLSYDPTLAPPVAGTPQDFITDHGSNNTEVNGIVYTAGCSDFNPITINGGIVAFCIRLQASSSEYHYQATYGNAAPPPGFPTVAFTFVGLRKSFIACSSYSDDSASATACQ